MSSAEESGESPLGALLRARIARDGPLPVDAFMRLCCTHPAHGYWQRQTTIGADGDFVTAPEISQVFGELLGVWAAVVWRGMGAPAPLRLIELGPGRGTLLCDALRAVLSQPRFLAAASLHLIEASAPLREMQRKTLAHGLRRGTSAPWLERQPAGTASARASSSNHAPAAAVALAWHAAIGEVPQGAAIVIANEYLDALPIRQLVFADGAWHERVVDVDRHGALCFAVGRVTTLGPEADPTAPAAVPGTIAELRPAEEELLADLARRQSPLVALFIDYGPMQPASGDTLQAVYRHAWVDPLSRPGRADLTAHVAFQRLAEKARAAGLSADGPMPQAEFLGRLGAVERAHRLMAANPKEAGAIEAGLQRLMSPTGMGGLCKVLAVRSRDVPPPVPFA